MASFHKYGISQYLFNLDPIFSNNFQNKNFTPRGIRTRIVTEEGEHADRLTTATTMAQDCNVFMGKIG